MWDWWDGEVRASSLRYCSRFCGREEAPRLRRSLKAVPFPDLLSCPPSSPPLMMRRFPGSQPVSFDYDSLALLEKEE